MNFITFCGKVIVGVLYKSGYSKLSIDHGLMYW